VQNGRAASGTISSHPVVQPKVRGTGRERERPEGPGKPKTRGKRQPDEGPRRTWRKSLQDAQVPMKPRTKTEGATKNGNKEREASLRLENARYFLVKHALCTENFNSDPTKEKMRKNRLKTREGQGKKQSLLSPDALHNFIPVQDIYTNIRRRLSGHTKKIRKEGRSTSGHVSIEKKTTHGGRKR